MFTGLIEEVGLVRSVEADAGGRTFDIGGALILDGLEVGDSISVDGVCQTVVARVEAAFRVQAVASTLARTTLGGFERGRRVNLERSLALGDRLGGHIVQGHTDETGRVVALADHGGHLLIDISYSPALAQATVLHGSIAVSGVSLTVNALPSAGTFQVSVIPHTREHTNLHDLVIGDEVNLEGDIFGKHVVRVLGYWKAELFERAGDPAGECGVRRAMTTRTPTHRR